MHKVETESWKTSLKVILDLDVPALFTSFNRQEGVKDYAIFRGLEANIHSEEPLLNPVRSLMPEFETWNTSVVDAFFQKNMYYVTVRGRKVTLE